VIFCARLFSCLETKYALNDCLFLSKIDVPISFLQHLYDLTIRVLTIVSVLLFIAFHLLSIKGYSTLSLMIQFHEFALHKFSSPVKNLTCTSHVSCGFNREHHALSSKYECKNILSSYFLLCSNQQQPDYTAPFLNGKHGSSLLSTSYYIDLSPVLSVIFLLTDL